MRTIRIAPTTRVAATYPASTPRPIQGANACGSWRPDIAVTPITDGNQRPTRTTTDGGKICTMIGATTRTNALTMIAAALLRTSAPNAIPHTQITVR